MDTLPFGSPLYLIYLLVFAVAAAGCLVGAFQARNVTLPDVRSGLIGLLVTSGLWALCHVGVLLSPDLGLKTGFYEAGLIAGFATVFAWFWLCSSYSGRSLHRKKTARWAAASVFVAAGLTKLTNQWHGLYFSAEWGARPFRHLAVDHHAIYWGTAAFSYALAAVGFFMLAEPLRQVKVGGKKLGGLFALTALPLGANAIGYATPYLLDLSHEPIGVAAFALGALALKDGQLEEASRAGREERPSLVLSRGGRIQNCNQAAARLFPALREKAAHQENAVGSRLEETLPGLSEALGRGTREKGEPSWEEIKEDVLEVSGAEGGARYIQPVETMARRGKARLVTLKDVTERELRRREQASRLESISDRMPGVTFKFRAGPGGERSVGFADGRAESFLGLSPGPDLSYERFLERIPEGHREAFLESVEKAVEGRSEWKQEFPFERPGGERMWILGSAQPETLKTDNPSEADKEEALLFRGLLLDVTGRKEEKRRRQEVIRRVTDGIVEVDAEWRVTLVNDQAEEIYGIGEEEMLGRNIWEVFEEGKGTRFQKVYQEVMRSREPAEIEEYFAGLDEWFDVQVYPNEDGGIALYFKVTTERKEREDALHERQEKFRGLYEATNHLLQAENREELSTRLAGLVHQTLGYEATTVRLIRSGKLVPAHVPGVVKERMPERPSYDIDGDTPAAEAYRSGETRAFEDLSAESEATRRGDIRATAYVPMGSHGLISVGSFEVGGIETLDLRLLEVLAGYAALVLDRLEREEELLAAKDRAEGAKQEAEEAARLKSSMLANMSHEIRTPLTSIIGFAEAIGTEFSELELPESSPLPKYADLIEQGGKRLLDTLEGVLNLSKLEAGQMEMEAAPVNLPKQARRAAEELRPKAEARQVDLRVGDHQDKDHQSGDIQAIADEGCVQIVLRNLLSNAIKYTDEGTVQVRTHQQNGHAVLEVEDTGIGMDPEAAGELFEPFRQASEGINREYEGTGIGLAVTREAVEQMDGSIEVDTEEGEGTCVTVRLPVARQAEAAQAPEGHLT